MNLLRVIFINVAEPKTLKKNMNSDQEFFTKRLWVFDITES